MADPLSDEQLAEIEQRADRHRLTPGERLSDQLDPNLVDPGLIEMERLVDEDVPALLRDVRRLHGDLATLRGKVGRYIDRIEVLARKHRRAVALRSTLRHLMRVQKKRGDDALAEVKRLRAERARAVEALSDIGQTAEAAAGDLEDGINAELLAFHAERDRLAEQARQARWAAAEMHEFNSPEGEHLPDCPGCRIERALDAEPGA